MSTASSPCSPHSWLLSPLPLPPCSAPSPPLLASVHPWCVLPFDQQLSVSPLQPRKMMVKDSKEAGDANHPQSPTKSSSSTLAPVHFSLVSGDPWSACLKGRFPSPTLLLRTMKMCWRAETCLLPCSQWCQALLLESSRILLTVSGPSVAFLPPSSPEVGTGVCPSRPSHR